MAAAQPVPCPVLLGTVRSGGLAAHLHRATLDRNLRKMEKLLKKRVNVDCVNHLGQTPLFCASLLGLTSAVELLLQYGADPNHRCTDMSTPVHAAVFSCKPWLLGSLLDAGGDLRLHDNDGRLPQDWAEAGAQEHSPRMLSFLRSCASHMISLSQAAQPLGLQRMDSHSCKFLLRSPSILELLKPGGSDLHTSTKSFTSDVVHCYGFGKLCVVRPQHRMGLLACMPLIADSDLGQAEDEPSLSYSCGSFISMISCSWKGCRVTVKELKCGGREGGFQDLLITEQEYCCQLFHPYLLQLMAVSMSCDLLRIRLVYERVHLGSLYSLLHQRREEFPMLQVGVLLTVVLHVCEALLYLDSQGLVLRGLSSHSVQIVHPTVAKVTNLGFMVLSEERTGPQRCAHPALPKELYNWAAPEVIRLRACTAKADLYSACTLIQEIYTDAVPWGPVEPRWIRQAVDSGESLVVDSRVPQPYYQLVRSGLQTQAQDRSSSLQDLRYLLRTDIRDLSSDSRRRSSLFPEALGLCTASSSPQPAEDKHCCLTGHPMAKDEAEKHLQVRLLGSMPDRGILNQPCQLDPLLDKKRGGVQNQWPRKDLGDKSEEGQACDLPSLCLLPDPLSITEADSEDDSGTEGKLEGIPPMHFHPSTVSEHIGSTVLNLKVSQVLLQQSEANLQAAAATCLGRGSTHGVNKVDGLCPDHVASGGSVFGRAVAPPLCYHPPLGDVLGECNLLATRGHPLWQGDYPSSEDREEHKRLYLSCRNEEPTYYLTAEEDSFDEETPAIVQVSAFGRGGQQVSGGPQCVSNQGHEDRKFAYPRVTDLRSIESCGRAKWMSEGPAEVSAVMARMTQRYLASRRNSKSKEMEENLCTSDPRKPGEVTESSHGTLDSESTGLQSETEEDTDLHTLNQTLQAPALNSAQERSSPESDGVRSPMEPFSMFLTLTSDRRLEQDSKPPSMEEDLEVKVDICQPAPSVMEWVNKIRPSEPGAAVEDSAVTKPNPATPIVFPAAGGCLSDFSDLAELSSITCSPAQQQESGRHHSISRCCPPSSSTPRSPGVPSCLHPQGELDYEVQRPRCRPVGSYGEPPPHPENLLNTSPWTSSPTAETFATACGKATGTPMTSVPSVPQSPVKIYTSLSHLSEKQATRASQSHDKDEHGTEPEENNQVEARESSSSDCIHSLSSNPCPETLPDTAISVDFVEEAEEPSLDRGEKNGKEEPAEVEVLDEKGMAYTQPMGSLVSEASLESGDHSALSKSASAENSQGRWRAAEHNRLPDDTDGAHSMLDMLLQGILAERAAGDKTTGYPAPLSCAKEKAGSESDNMELKTEDTIPSVPTKGNVHERSEAGGCRKGDLETASATVPDQPPTKRHRDPNLALVK